VVVDQKLTIPGLNDEGFLSLPKLRKQALELDRDDFVARYSVPALVARARDLAAAGLLEVTDEESGGIQLLTRAIRTPDFLRYLGKAAFLVKRPGNPFPHFISIGRSPRNDITVGVDSISKVHGVFVNEEDTWSFTDRNSSNGSSVDDKTAEPGRRMRLEDGSILRLGLEAVFEVIYPPSLYRRAQRGF